MTNLINGRTVEIIKIGLINLLNNCGDIRGESTRCLQELCPYYGDDCCEESILSGVLALIEHLEAQQPTWISVKERLPEMYEDGSADIVLVTDGQFIHMAAYSNEKWYFAECGEMKEPMFYKVTHWMPLPEPPEEEQE